MELKISQSKEMAAMACVPLEDFDPIGDANHFMKLKTAFVKRGYNIESDVYHEYTHVRVYDGEGDGPIITSAQSADEVTATLRAILSVIEEHHGG